MTDRAQQAADAIAALGSVSASSARRTLGEYAVRDQVAALAVATTVKHVVVGIDYTGINPTTGLADLYLLPEGETIVAAWPVVTETFDGQGSGASAFSVAQAYGPNGFNGGAQLSDSFDAVQSSVANAIDGLMGPDPADGGGSNTTTSMVPLVSPAIGGGAVQLVIDFTSGNAPLDTIGTQGHLDFHLIIAVA